MTYTQHFISNFMGVRILAVLTFATTIVILAGFTLIEVGLAVEPINEQIVKQNKLQKGTPNNSSTKCQGFADCFKGSVTEVVDGDTIDVNSVRIRLALVDAPELNETGYLEARNFVESRCNIGTPATVDQDDRQKGGSFGRMIAQVFCGNDDVSINEAILDSGYATIYREFCNISEFATNPWGVKYCTSSGLQKVPTSLPSVKRGVEQSNIEAGESGNEKNCNSSYPDFCIKPPPPDLDCADISQKNFTVRGSDPHRFDLDGNGKGCEN
jgi:micrococcal nuclease